MRNSLAKPLLTNVYSFVSPSPISITLHVTHKPSYYACITTALLSKKIQLLPLPDKMLRTPWTLHLNFSNWQLLCLLHSFPKESLFHYTSSPTFNQFTLHSYNNKSHPSAVTNIWHSLVIHVLNLSLLLLDMHVKIKAEVEEKVSI